MKTIQSAFLFAMLLGSIQLHALEDKSAHPRFLTASEFSRLYEADQKKYIMLLRKATVSLSFQDSLIVENNLDLDTSREPANAMYNQSQMRAQITKLNSDADKLLKPPRGRTWREIGWAILEGLMDWVVDGAEGAARKQEQAMAEEERALPNAIKELFQRRLNLTREVAMMSTADQAKLSPLLKSSEANFDALRRKAHAQGDNSLDSFLQTFERSYDSAVARLASAQTEAATAGESPQGLRIVLYDPNAPVEAASEDASPRNCVRCIYGGFVISDMNECEAVKTPEQMTKQIGNLTYPPPLKAENFKCARSSRPVMCNPLVFGTQNGGPICIASSRSATRDCMAQAGTDAESLTMTKKIIEQNLTQHSQMVSKLADICSQKNLCNSNARISDIRETCLAIREQMDIFREGMRQLSSGTLASAASRDATRTRPERRGDSGGVSVSDVIDVGTGR